MNFMNKTTRILPAFLLMASLLVGCSESGGTSSSATSSEEISSSTDVEVEQTGTTATVKLYKNNNSTSTDRFIPYDKVDLKYTYTELSGMLSNNESVFPSIGEVNLLVIPVHITGSEEYMTDEVREDIEQVFFGDTETDSDLGFYSLSDYYYESSFGKLRVKGEVTDWFDVADAGITDIDEITISSSGTIQQKILPAAVEWASEQQGIDLQDYDYNEDGNIDGVFLVYDHLDYSTYYEQSLKYETEVDESDMNESFWNFSSWDWNTSAATSTRVDPTTSGFSWCSFDMMYTSYCSRQTSTEYADLTDFSKIPLDSHTYIHEFGHLLGLNDYYSSSDSDYHPMGEFTMMDQNVGDLDTYSKMLLGWVTPYVVYGTSEITIEAANANDHSVIVIPENFEEISDEIESVIKNDLVEEYTYSFNPFSEYLLIDLYTPDGLNYQDTYGEYVYGREEGIAGYGVRIYHIDARIFQCTAISYADGTYLSYIDGYEWDGGTISTNQYILMPISNSMIESSSYNLPSSYDYFDECRLLEAGGFNTFSDGGYADASTLWTASSTPFSIEQFGNLFFNANYCFNNGNDLPFRVAVESVDRR